MKSIFAVILAILYVIVPHAVIAQNDDPYFLNCSEIKLDSKYTNEEFSGLAKWGADTIILLPQLAQANGVDAPLYYTSGSEINSSISNHENLTLHPLMIKGLSQYRLLPGYEGLEAVVVVGSNIYFAIETSSKAKTKDYVDSCIIIKGTISKKEIVLDKQGMVRIAKPRDANQRLVENGGFESLAWVQPLNKLLAVFEYNHLQRDGRSTAFLIDPALTTKPKPIPIDSVHFRISDAWYSEASNQLFALNFWYHGDYKSYGSNPAWYQDLGDAIAPQHDNLCRILVADQMDGSFSKWKKVGRVPDLTNRNWEGMVPFEKGFLIISDNNRWDVMKTTFLYLH